MKYFYQIKAIFAGLLLSSVMLPVATADDIEIYTTSAAKVGAQNPKIMFVVDTSASMGVTTLVDPDYVEDTEYPGNSAEAFVCEPEGVYFTDNGELPDCEYTKYFTKSALVCNHAMSLYDNENNRVTPPTDGTLILIGTYSDQFAQYDTANNRWREVSIGDDADRDLKVECLLDSGEHGISDSSNKLFITNGGVEGYTSEEPVDPAVPHPVWEGGKGHIQLFNGNYLNYLNTEFAEADKVERSYIDQVQSAIEIMVKGNTRIDIGLMRFDTLKVTGNTATGSEGGSVNYPITDIIADRNDFFQRIDLTPNGETPLSETYYEALLYFGGKTTDYSAVSNPSNQVVARTLKPGGTEFESPISAVCNKSYIVVLSDGDATMDNVNTVNAAGVDRLSESILSGFDKTSCNTQVTLDNNIDDNDDAGSDVVNATVSNYKVSTVDNCLDELAHWAFTNDVAVDPTNPAHEGEQKVTTHAIGFGYGDTPSQGQRDGKLLLQSTADGANGEFFTADSKGELVTIFNKIISGILKVNSTFSSPAVSVNAFNRSTHLNDLYFSLFKPGEASHWEGNLKKYKLEFAVDSADKDGDGDVTEKLPFIADWLHAEAVDPATGFFSDNAKSYWNSGDAADGKEVSEGGVAGMFTSRASARNVYTITGLYSETSGVYVPATGDLTAGENAVDPGNDSLTAELLLVSAEPLIVADTTNRDTVINWAKGLDALSNFGDVNTYTDQRPQMGDLLHSEPALVQYGEDINGVADIVAYLATNDGYLHAVDVDDGSEVFSFIPQELLPNLTTAMAAGGSDKLYGLDGNVVAWINDINGDGDVLDTVDGVREHAYIYVTMRRGGKNIYALDVTDRNNPSLLWVIKGGGDSGDYTELGQTWSSVNVGKIKDADVEKTVLVFGGGYDDGQDDVEVTSEDGEGRTVYIADAASGARLWTADAHDESAPVVTMNYSVPARVQTIDISGDGYIDRLYVADMGGQIFRFDINNTNGASLSSSITGGLIADLADASKAAEDRVDTNARRFYYPPDVALINAQDGLYHVLVISSGFRAGPLNDKVQDRIYMIKDRQTTLTSTYTTLTEDNLHNATNNIAGGDAATDAARDTELTSLRSKEGWYIYLEDETSPGTWLGEKGLSEALIIAGTAIVTTYTPNLTALADSCGPSLGIGKVYFLNILDATPAFPGNLDVRSERHTELVRGGIPPTPNIIMTKEGVPTLCVGTECQKADFGLGLRKIYWYEVN